MGKTLGGAGGVVMVAAVNGVVGVPWIVVGAVVALVVLLVFVDKLAFCKQGPEPTRRFIAIIRVVKSPSSPPGRRDRRRAKPPGQP